MANITSTVDAITEMSREETVRLFEKHRVYTREELQSRQAICFDNYVKQIAIEANVMVSMGRTSILPAAFGYSDRLSRAIASVRNVDPQLDSSTHRRCLEKLLTAISSFDRELSELEGLIAEGEKLEAGGYETARFYRYRVFEKMEELRRFGDVLETLVPKEDWPFPNYEEMLFRL